MVMDEQLQEKSFSLLTIIVNRGKGSKILDFARKNGVRNASCLLGKGTMNNKMLQMIEMNDIEKEIILAIIPTTKEDEILKQLNLKFNFARKNFGIAFTTPLCGIMNMKKDPLIKWNNSQILSTTQRDYEVLFIIVNKGKASSVIETSQNAGYYGGTVIKGRGSASKLNIVLDMMVEPEKEAVLILIESKKANQLATLLYEQLLLNQPNTGVLFKIGISKTIGLFQNRKQEEEIQ